MTQIFYRTQELVRLRLKGYDGLYRVIDVQRRARTEGGVYKESICYKLIHEVNGQVVKYGVSQTWFDQKCLEKVHCASPHSFEELLLILNKNKEVQ